LKKGIKHILKSKYLYIAFISIAITFFIHLITPKQAKEGNFFIALFITFVISFFVWEGTFRIDRYMNSKFPWEKQPFKRAINQGIISIIYSIIIIWIGTFAFDVFVCPIPEPDRSKMRNAGIIIGALFTLIIMAIEVGTQFFNNWKTSLSEVEKYKKESIEAQLENLKSQVNPHFLFNNLSVLSSLVYKDQDKAVDFINQFSKVYRYILDNKSKELIELETELKFIESYCYLLSIRFGEGIKFNFNISSDKMGGLLPPMALQLLIENTIKHNETSLEMPLHVDIYTKDDYLIVSNNLQVRKLNEESSRMGLKNIMSRYRHYTKMEVHIHTSEKIFEVRLPLLKSI
jgi:two-component system LytT family sensor kinase